MQMQDWQGGKRVHAQQMDGDAQSSSGTSTQCHTVLSAPAGSSLTCRVQPPLPAALCNSPMRGRAQGKNSRRWEEGAIPCKLTRGPIVNGLLTLCCFPPALCLSHCLTLPRKAFTICPGQRGYHYTGNLVETGVAGQTRIASPLSAVLFFHHHQSVTENLDHSVHIKSVTAELIS